MGQSLINEFKAVSGCVLILDPQTIAGNDGDSITSITDQSANASTVGFVSGTHPTIKRNPYPYSGRDAMRWAAVNSSGLSVTGLTLPGNGGHTLVAVVRPDRVTSGNAYTIFGDGSSVNAYARAAVNRLTVFQGSAKDFGPGVSGSPTSFSGAGGGYQFFNDWNILIIRASGTTTAFRGYLNGESTTVSKATMADTTTLYIGQVAAGTSPFAGDMGFVAAFNVELTDGQVDNVAALLRAAFPWTPVPKGRAAFFFLGDSLTLGNYAATNSARWKESALTGATNIPADYRRGVETAWPSTQVTGLDACWGGTGGFKTLMPSDAANPIVVVFCGTNDVLIGGQSGATVNTRLENHAGTIKTALPAAKVMVITMLPRQSVTTVRTDLNNALMTNTSLVSGILYAKTSSNIDFIGAIHLNTTIGEDGDNTDTTNYNADQIHLNSTGHGVMGTAIKSALEYLYGLSSGSAPYVTGVTLSPQSCSEGSTTTLSASVAGSGAYSSSVTWEVISGSGSVNASTGVFSAAGLLAGATAVVRARSVYDPYFYADATVTVVTGGGSGSGGGAGSPRLRVPGP